MIDGYPATVAEDSVGWPATEARRRSTRVCSARCLLQKLVNESNRHAALTHGRGDALNRTQPDITARKDPWNARLQKQGIALARPTPGLDHIVSGQHISARITRYLLREPPGFRICSYEDE